MTLPEARQRGTGTTVMCRGSFGRMHPHRRLTLGDVRRFLAEVDRLGIEESRMIEADVEVTDTGRQVTVALRTIHSPVSA